MHTIITRTLLGLAVLLLAVPVTLAQGKKSEAVVKVNASATKPDSEGIQTVTITIEIDKPWHLYANPVGNDLLGPAATTVKFPKIEGDAKITYPAGKLVKDATTGDYRVYEGKLTITAKVKRAKDDSGPLEYSISLQACNDTSCLLKSVIKKTVP